MKSRFPTLAMTLFCVVLAGTSLALWGCGAEPAPTTSEPVTVSGTTASTAAPIAPSIEEAWAASLAALEALGPTRVSIIETTEGRATGDEIPADQSNFGPQTEEAEQLFDIARSRARLTVHTSDRMVKMTVVQGKERMSTTSQPLTNSDLVSVSRYISLQAPEGLPLPLWAGNAVGPTERATPTCSKAATAAPRQYPQMARWSSRRTAARNSPGNVPPTALPQP
jgi:hypothetical protein